MDNYYFLIPTFILLGILFFMTILHFKKKAAIKKVNALSLAEKKNILDNLADVGGYTYEPYQDIFTTKLDAPQKIFGYNTFYDFSAPYFNMIFDYETIYFDYKNRTWLIEMWKGQYGLNTGCELGIYYADEIVPPERYTSTHFKSVESDDMLDIYLKLNRHCPKKNCPYSKFGHLRQKHWWLTIFKMGTFTKPKELFVNTSIHFKDYGMMYSFLESFQKTIPDTTYKISGLTVYFTFYESHRKHSFFRKIIHRIALSMCHIYCQWFQFFTRPFSNTGDKLLYIYYYLPFIVTHIFKK